MNSSPRIKACARPSGLGWTLYLQVQAVLAAVTQQRLKARGVSVGVEMIRMSWMPASISVDSG